MKYIKEFEKLNIQDVVDLITHYGVTRLRTLIDFEKDINKIYIFKPDKTHNSNILILACKFRNFFLIKELIKCGADLNMVDGEGDTALIKILKAYRSEIYTLKIVNLLVDAGADLNAQDRIGNTPLILSHDLDIRYILIDAGADWNKKNRDGEDFLDILNKFDNFETIDKIIKKYPKQYKNYLYVKELEKYTDKYNL